MAAADLRDEQSCSICLNIYTDPVMLPCGHNYCRGCIGGLLDTQEGSGGYSCPECRAEFQQRPALQRNRTLGNIAERFLPAQSEQQGAPGIYCTYCIQSPVAATKSCLHCEASLCDNHVRVHSKSAEHILCQPSDSLPNRKCSAHKRLLEYYCMEDNACICVSCHIVGHHIGHKVALLSEASERKKGKLRNALERLILKRERAERDSQRLQERRREMEEKAANETERVTALFRGIREQLEALEERVLSEISRQRDSLLLCFSDLIQQLEMNKEELSREIHDTEELCNMADPLTVLQGAELDGDAFCDAWEAETEGRGSGGNKDPTIWDLDEDLISEKLLTGLAGIVRSMKAAIRHTGQDTNPEAEGAELSAPVPLPPAESNGPGHLCDTPGSLAPQAESDPLYGLKATDMSIDINTMNNRLEFIDKGVHWCSKFADHFPTCERFQDYPQALSIQSFSSGRHYWDVKWVKVVVTGSTGYCIIGVAYPSMQRYGQESYIGRNKKSVGLFLWDDRYSVIHDGQRKNLPYISTCNKIRVSLDYDGGRLSFYELSEPIRHLHTVTATFTEPLHAAFWVWKSSLTINK
ncbi:E3 ubiquitin/ISG15 ligase TRIM25 [Xenopus tropicalis]|uniref:E3 ubiquitin/ISG15 ligase TRIM25 n=1 Tax=Xenopus tropicalis TaxID=8364 RepID=A0A803JZX1_XENTR|nr:E3 ubiquitin/ISG15 ligase TRIM25 [Xenopus tropicalis]|eukprot:XP_004911544.2 PREDICTED: E3 ubiquitin/ISG15 ligase TRIM25-like [Xenopus tropicalis]